MGFTASLNQRYVIWVLQFKRTSNVPYHLIIKRENVFVLTRWLFNQMGMLLIVEIIQI